MNPGAKTEAGRDDQISSTQLVLKQGGFGFKYVVYSGIAPGEKASSDGLHVKLLGYKWDSKNDVLYRGFAELNLDKKVPGAMKSNTVPVVTLSGIQLRSSRWSSSFYSGVSTAAVSVRPQCQSSFPRRRESSVAVWIPACAGMTEYTNSMIPQRDSPQSI